MRTSADSPQLFVSSRYKSQFNRLNGYCSVPSNLHMALRHST